MPISKDKTRLSATLDLKTAQKVEEYASNEKRTVSAMLAILIAEALENRSKTQHGFVRGADYYKSVSDNADKP